jgi:hypothetical protein
MVISPLFIFSSGTMLSQPSATMFLALGGLGYARMHTGKRRSQLWALICGVALSWSFYCRPASAGLVGFICLHLAVSVVTSRGRVLRRAWPMVIGAALPIAAFGGINVALGASPFYPLPPHINRETPGLGLNTMIGQVRFTPLLAASNAADNLLKLNLWGFGWPVSLFPAALALLRVGKNEGKRRSAAIALALAASCHFVLVSTYWSSGIGDLAPIYHLSLMPIVAMLAGRGIVMGRELLAALEERPELARTWVALVGALCLVATPAAWVIQALGLGAVQRRVQAPYRLVEQSGIERDAVVFVRQAAPRVSWVMSPRISTPPWDAPVIYLADQGIEADRALVRRRFPDRTAYRVGIVRDHWVLQRVRDGKVLSEGSPKWGDRVPYRIPYPYSVFPLVEPARKKM